MADSIYAPPKANVELSETDGHDFYVVAARKFFLLSILTMNAYLVYWFYRNWSIVKRRTGDDCWPPMRGLFYVFFTHALFGLVDSRIKAQEKQFDWQPGATATLVVVLTIVGNVLARMAGSEVGSPTTDFISLLLVPILTAVMYKAQAAINFACEDPAGASNARLTGLNYAWIVTCALLWILMLFGLAAFYFMPEA